jgi:endoglucanase
MPVVHHRWYHTMKLLVSLLVLCFITQGISADDIFAANKALGRGVNFGNALEAPRGQNWGVTIQDEYFAVIKQAGFDHVRLPVKWSSYAATSAPYTIETEFFARIDHLLDVAEKHQLRVVLNIHHFDELDKEPEKHVDHFIALWKQIASRYAKRPDTLYFELHNEPHDKLDDKKWNTILVKGLAAVRESNPTRPVIIGPAFWNGIWALPKLTLPEDKNLIVTVHNYNPFEFTHQGATWTDPKVRNIKDRKWEGTDKELAALRKELDQAAAYGKKHHKPIYLGEFGAFGSAPLESRVKWTTAMAREAEARGMSWAYWEFGAGFGIYDVKKNQWRKPLLKALVPGE